MRNPTSIGAVVGFLVLAVVGCGDLQTDYGRTRGSTARRSLNGFATLRTAFASTGADQRDIGRLTDRVAQSDVIVWTPRVYAPIATEVTRWFDDWLAGGDRTLVYIIADSGSEADYWTEAVRLAPPSMRLEYRRRAARAINERIAWRTNRHPIASNGWFAINPRQNPVRVDALTGAWSDRLGGDVDRWSTEYELMPAESALAIDDSDGMNLPTGPGDGGGWVVNQATPTDTEVEFEPLLGTSSTTLVARVRSDAWDDSQILLVAGGSLLTNYALSHDSNRMLAAALINATTAAGQPRKVGFLTTDRSGVAVSNREPGVPVATGMELLTVWPLSLVTMHGLMLGLIICLVLLPIFGRPRRFGRGESTDFGDHLDAVAALMNRRGNESYARQRLAEYFHKIHGEKPGPESSVASLTPADDKRPTPPLVTPPGDDQTASSSTA